VSSLRHPPTRGAVGRTPCRQQRRRGQAAALATGTATRVLRLGHEAVAGSGPSYGPSLGLSRPRSPVLADLRARIGPASES
jgi:hypothetical protein